MKALQDEETQKRGTVWVNLETGVCAMTPIDFLKKQEIKTGIPWRIAGGHICLKNAALRPLVVGFQLFLDPHHRNRMRVHYGTQEQTEFVLQTFGIPTQDIKLKENGMLDTTAHLEFLERLKLMEEQETDADAASNKNNKANNGGQSEHVIIPRKFDVLFGKSRRAKEHTGTKRALHLVETEFEAYESLSRYQKADIADRIITTIQQSGGRFLRQDSSGGWVLADRTDAKKKVAHWFRHVRSKKSHPQSNSSETPLSDNSSEDFGADEVATKRVAPWLSHKDFQAIATPADFHEHHPPHKKAMYV